MVPVIAIQPCMYVVQQGCLRCYLNVSENTSRFALNEPMSVSVHATELALGSTLSINTCYLRVHTQCDLDIRSFITKLKILYCLSFVDKAPLYPLVYLRRHFVSAPNNGFAGTQKILNDNYHNLLLP